MTDVSRFLNPQYRNLQPYTPGEQLRGKKIIKLNTNESPFPPSPKVIEAIKREAKSLNLYPDISGGELLHALAEYYGVKRENVFAGNGSDEILAFIFQALCPDGAAFADLTYGFYPVYARLYGVDAKVIPLREDLTVPVDAFTGLGHTIFIANPNAPTGLALALCDIERIVQANRDSLVVIDEAYVDFGAESSVCLLEQYDNLMVVGTFSKSRSLAGGRLGYALASEELIADLERIKFSFNPYNVNQMTQAAGTAALLDEDYFAACTNSIVQTRQVSTQRLTELGFTCTASLANFIFARHHSKSAKELYSALKQRDIYVRWFDVPRISNYLRITVGSPQEMDTLCAALKEIVEK